MAVSAATVSPSTEQLLPHLREMLYAPLNEPPIAVTGHSVVYRTFSQLYRGTVAVKIINKKALPPAIADKFLPRELDITVKVRHPHLSRCLSVIAPSNSKIVLVSEFYERGTLLALILREQRIKELPQGVRMFRQLMEAVHYLHERNIDNPPNMTRAALTFPDSIPSPSCRRLIAALLEPDEELRAGYHDCVHSEWMAFQPNWIFADQNFVYQHIHSH
ncbi:unnamed protein product [Nippostrongylus brasiliensis]|uniref:Protein kinase domain-containing protein n=1 Tax=Nippostrongylus brasiliensis TaxID=27835 RepID=A0A0N4YBN2_NIPBR|nr:unnamed protein product [Nippostrongylus brasiliensis]